MRDLERMMFGAMVGFSVAIVAKVAYEIGKQVGANSRYVTPMWTVVEDCSEEENTL